MATVTCPQCGGDAVPLMFGLPGPEAVEAAKAGELALGGCELPPGEPPNYRCRAGGHEWREGDSTRQRAAHGRRRRPRRPRR